MRDLAEGDRVSGLRARSRIRVGLEYHNKTAELIAGRSR